MAFRKAILNCELQKRFFGINLDTLNAKLEKNNKPPILFDQKTGIVTIPKVNNHILEIFLNVERLDQKNPDDLRSIGSVIRSISRILVSFAPYEIKLIIDLSHLDSEKLIFEVLEEIRWGSVSEFLLQDIFVVTKLDDLKSDCYTFVNSIKTKPFFDISKEIFKYQDLKVLNLCSDIYRNIKNRCLYFKWNSSQQCAEISTIWFCIEGIYKHKIDRLMIDTPKNKKLDIVCFVDKGQNQIRLIQVLNKFCKLFDVDIVLLIGSFKIYTKGYRRLKKFLWESCCEKIQATAFTDNSEVVEFLKNRKDSGYEIYSVDLDKSATVLEFGKKNFKYCNSNKVTLLFGGEKNGIPYEINKEATIKLMLDTTSSINLVSCAIIVLFDYFNN